VAVEGLYHVELGRLRLAVKTVLDVRADDRRRRLRPQRERAVAPVGERVHLLAYDVRGFSGRAAEELRVFERRCVQAPVAVQRAELLELPDDPPPARLFGREYVVRSPRRFELQVARNSVKKGLRASSSPSVVGGP